MTRTRREDPPLDRALHRRNPLLAWWKHLAAPYQWLTDLRYFETHDEIPSPRAGFRAYRARTKLVHRYAWAIPTDDALRVIAKYAPLVEIGAGTGYRAWLLRRDCGVDILAYDAHPRRRVFTPVLRGGPRKAERCSDRTLFLCWPRYHDEMAQRALAFYGGAHVIYIGEERGGCNATDGFFVALETEWECLEDLALPQWDGIQDRLRVYRRR